MVIINKEILQEFAPAALATSPSQHLSDRYQFLPTTEIVEVLQDEGWTLWNAVQVKPRKAEKLHAKHMLRFRHEDLDAENFSAGDSFPEMLLINAHNGSSSYTLRAGIFRLICSNGMVVSEEDFGKIRIRHTGSYQKDVQHYSRQMIQNTSRLSETVESWRNTTLSEEDIRSYNADAARIRFEDPDEHTISNVGSYRRFDDHGRDLWRAFQRAQENLIRGGFQVGKRRARKVNSIDKNVAINESLWQLTSNYFEACQN